MLKVKKYDEAYGAKMAFIVCYAFFVMIFALVMHFVILIKGWGLEVHSWSWLIWLWILAGLVSTVKDIVIKTIKKIS